jgi:hypothetical protein
MAAQYLVVFSDIVSTDAVHTLQGRVNSVQGLKIHVSELLQNKRSNVANTGRKSQMCWKGYELQQITDFD